MLYQALAPALLARCDDVLAALIGVLPALELELNRRAVQPQALAECAYQIAPVVVRYFVRLIAVNDDLGRRRAARSE